MRARPFLALLAVIIVASPASALSLQDATLISPITNQPFTVQLLAQSSEAGRELADLGADLDGCRHTLGQSEYEYGVIVDPTSYFAALAGEWDPRSGAFLYPLDDKVKTFVQKTWDGERSIDINNAYGTVLRQARAAGQVPPDRATWVMPQRMIRVEKRYSIALSCYEARRARASVMAKIALQAAWALRTYVNISLANPSLDGGYQEVDDRAKREFSFDEPFRVEKHYKVYRGMMDDGKLTDEGYFVAGMRSFGLAMRLGDLAQSVDVLKLMEERFRDAQKKEMLRQISRERRETFRKHQDFIALAAVNFQRAIADEQINRTQLPATMLGLAECLRRLGRLDDAAQWYFALSSMPETQPKLREDVRRQGRTPSADAPVAVQLGWLADEQYAALKAAGAKHDGQLGGPDRALLVALVAEGLGSADYVNPDWKPATGGNANDCISVMSRIGDTSLNFAFRTGLWPLTLGELWDRDFIDRNQVNRFRCPVSGQAFRYAEPPAAYDAVSKDMVLIATATAIETPMGPRYGAYLVGRQVVWSQNPIEPGKNFTR